MPLKLVTWNVHGFVGADGIADPGRAAAVLEQLAPDVIGLQEVDCRERAVGGGTRLEQLADTIGMAAVAGPTRFEQDGYFGNAVLTRLPIVSTRRLDVSVEGREARGVLEVHLDVGSTGLRVLVTHFGVRAAERRQQVDRLLERIDAGSEEPLALMGDFNEWLPKTLSLARIHLAMGRAPAPRSFPARAPLLRLDRIWVLPPELLVDVRTRRVPGIAQVSDHLPVQGLVELPN